jgi:peptide deformylase
MALRNIVVEGDPILRKKCREIDAVDDRIRTILDDMVETMEDANGVGLAAPQIGMMRRMFVAEPEPGEIYYFVNPEIVSRAGMQESEEGCLSVPGYYGLVDRPEKVRIKGLDRNGELCEYEFEGFKAVVMCHEYDHLDGILYIDKAKEMYQMTDEGE